MSFTSDQCFCSSLRSWFLSLAAVPIKRQFRGSWKCDTPASTHSSLTTPSHGMELLIFPLSGRSLCVTEMFLTHTVFTIISCHGWVCECVSILSWAPIVPPRLVAVNRIAVLWSETFSQQVYLQESLLPSDHGETHNLWRKRLSLKPNDTHSYRGVSVMSQRHHHDVATGEMPLQWLFLIDLIFLLFFPPNLFYPSVLCFQKHFCFIFTLF